MLDERLGPRAGKAQLSRQITVEAFDVAFEGCAIIVDLEVGPKGVVELASLLAGGEAWPFDSEFGNEILACHLEVRVGDLDTRLFGERGDGGREVVGESGLGAGVGELGSKPGETDRAAMEAFGVVAAAEHPVQRGPSPRIGRISESTRALDQRQQST